MRLAVRVKLSLSGPMGTSLQFQSWSMISSF